MTGNTARIVLDILQHIGLFAIAVVGYSLVRARMEQFGRHWQQAVLGVFFGTGAVLAMFDAVLVLPGVFVDARMTMVALATLYGGPLAGVITGAMAGAYRVWLGGAATPAAVVALASVVATSLGFAALMRWRRWRRDLLRHGALGLTAAVASLLSVLLLPTLDQAVAVMSRVALPLVISNVVGAAFLGTLLRLEERRRAAEAAVADSEAFYRALYAEATDCLFVVAVGEDGGFTYQSLNPASARALGVSAVRPGIRPDALFPPQFAAKICDLYARCVAERSTLRFEETLETAEGLRNWDTVLVPLMDADGRVTRILGNARDVTDRERLLASLAEAKEQAEAGARAKADFLAAMSHEIRTPMNGILGYATFLEDLAQDGAVRDEKQRQNDQRHYARQLKQACKSLLAIINDVLDLSKIEAGKVDIDHIPFNLNEAIDHVVSLVQPAAREKRLDLRVDRAADAPAFVTGDPVRLRQVLLNLLSNAVKFTPSGGVGMSVVVVDRRPDAVTLNFVVSDTGIGIPEDKQTLLFQKFSQIDRTVARQYGGSGLGLAISKRLVEAMGGTIGFHSAAGVGSTFYVTLTLPVPDPAGLADAEGAADCSDEVFRRGHILVVEDLGMNQELIARMLTNAGHTVDLASDGQEAVAAVRGRRYDLVLMDLQMPVMDGLRATETIRALDGEAARVPIVALTATVLPAEVERCRTAGMDAHLAKPVEREALLACVQRWLRPGGTILDAGPHPNPPPPSAGEGIKPAPVRSMGGGRGPVATPSPTGPDAVMQRLLRDLGPETLCSLLDMFLAALPDRLAAASAVCEGEGTPDWTRLAKDAHTAASLGGNLGFMELTEASRALMQAASSDPRPADASALIARYRAAGTAALAAAEAQQATLRGTALATKET
ncbi:ATP-binding protein [Azospirillum soli]|uniref:ATP-binding protein n=1 Tax=Azospirillum soli TaxID=1304799 RepID=UPI001AE21E14|nr:ATP-binding protein [Azospirillum soli]MBP2313665.1 PAS domain S-box-containing protein [Azospirillum soli]